ncbi:MAG: hypothetical protein J6Q61_02750 [Bacteroidales bacterium]|nr:hypothetical protein [Bacteroidales bacterium]MBO5853636.1 hypothetical protein [Bacteroidales bacterium]
MVVMTFGEESEQEKIFKERYNESLRGVRNLFSTEEGKRVLDFLRLRWTKTTFDQNHPSERALFLQGKIDALNDIMSIIDNVNGGML